MCLILLFYRLLEGSEIFRLRFFVCYGGWGLLYLFWGKKFDFKFESSYLGLG